MRKLSKKHLELTKIERQNVGKALDIFSRDLVAAMETYRRQNVSGFVDCQETIMFMKKFIKWFEIHDSCNLTQAILKRLPNKAPFSSENDERLQWLEAFLKWLKSWKDKIVDEKEFLTSETYEAIVLTTKSTIAKIKYLLKDLKFQFVFNSSTVHSQVQQR